MTSSKFSGFWPPPPCQYPIHATSPSFGQNLANPPPPSLLTSFMYGPLRHIDHFVHICLALLLLRNVGQCIYRFVQIWLISYIACPLWILGTKSCQAWGPSRKDGLRRRTLTNLSVIATSQIFATGACTNAVKEAYRQLEKEQKKTMMRQSNNRRLCYLGGGGVKNTENLAVVICTCFLRWLTWPCFHSNECRRCRGIRGPSGSAAEQFSACGLWSPSAGLANGLAG